MRWVVGNLTVQVVDATPVEVSWLSRYLSYIDQSYRPDRPKREERRTALYNIVTDEFYTGLARMAYDEAMKQGFQVMVDDQRRAPCAPDLAADLEWLRHHPAVTTPITHQIEAVQAAAKARRGLIWVPTGGGKTEIAVGLSRVLPCRWLVLLHSGDLLGQTAARYEKRTGLPAGIVGDGRFKVPDGCRFIVAMFQTMHAGLGSGRRDVIDLLLGAEGLLVDECHTLPADTFLQVAMATPSAYYRYGLSGTPLARSDGANLYLVGALGPVVYRIMPEVLIKLGILARPVIRMVDVVQQSDRPTWDGVYGECIARSAKRNRVVVDCARQAAKPALVFVQEVKHGKALTERLQKAGLKVEFTWGEKATAQRQAAIERLVRGDTEVLVSNVIFQAGIDIPSLRAVIVATGGRSAIATIQRIGRGMRADAETGKTSFEVWDIADRGCGCRPDVDFGEHPGCKWLERHTRARHRYYESEGYDVKIVRDQGELDLGQDAR